MTSTLDQAHSNATTLAIKPNKSANVRSAPDSGTRECPIKFVCVSRPFWDFQLEYQSEVDDDDDDSCANSPWEKKWTDTLKEARKTWLKPAAEFPGITWALSSKARKLNKKYALQAQKSDQDSFGMFIYNDFTGYGLQEVIQNQLSAFRKEFTSREPSPFVLWSMMESLAWWLNSTDTMLWNMIDDGRRVYETLQMICLAILSTLNILEQANLLRNDSDILNIPLILSLFLGFLGCFDDALSLRGKHQYWPYAVAAYAKKHNIEIKGKYRVTGNLYGADRLSTRKIADVWKKATRDKWNFEPRYRNFSAAYGDGGLEFDITKMSKADRIAKSFDNMDPLDELPPFPSEDQSTDVDEAFSEVDSKEDIK